ncbi:helix-turn-helix domain-containing protein [Streptomyces sp. NPDC057494]|uniref:helix-turn-helix domain-containing protein n=1 Tax=Streptomyces sp. NPDC057494 TaxID=3346148 RepID=UPI003699E92E
MLLAARGRPNARIAVDVGVHVDTVRTWRGRFADGSLPTLADRRPSGRPARFTPVQVAAAKAPASRLPAETAEPLTRWSCAGLAAEPPPRAGQGDARQPHLRPRGCRGLPGRLRRPPGENLRPLRGHHRRRAVHGLGRTGPDHRALRRCQMRLLDRRQRLLSRQESCIALAA